MLAMDQDTEQRDLGDQIQMRKTNNRDKSMKCNQCDYASSQAGNLRRHLKTHSGEKTKKCNQCDYASSNASHLRTHEKTQRGKAKQMQPLQLCIL